MYINQAKQLIKRVYRIQQKTGKRFAIELVGGPGCGKSECIPQLARELSHELDTPFTVKDFFLTTVEPPDVRGFGLPGKDDDGALLMQFTKAPWMPRESDAKHGFILLDEFAQANNDVKKPAAELLNSGRVGDSQLPLEYMVIAASNRESDRSGAHRDLAFIANRKMVIQIEPNLDAWVDWAEREAIHPFAVAFAKSKPGLVFQDRVPEKPGPFCTPRTLVRVSYLINELPMELFTEAVQGYIGEGAGAEFVSFLRVASELPEYEEIVAAPTKVKVPDRPDAMYAAMQMVAYRVDDATAPAAFEYLKRFPKEFQVAGLKAAIRRARNITKGKNFEKWLIENRELIAAAAVL